ncbi:hypothetical protein AQS8620_02323 [Aquimixticola soesokkakensis]|uniref:Leucine-binding protein domain-containing protein n=1 Tax=Aquimixticola soesokkakensis TaxID=1519096 RepID=A0A1Y5T5S1_9RHOB|nr:penicillin-binding protein activator [Aquimixticola soesokkakensis]SLN53144.1 hypothetical protein AQS8620_02323 [Aquimixticola soesokkakensis]
MFALLSRARMSLARLASSRSVSARMGRRAALVLALPLLAACDPSMMPASGGASGTVDTTKPVQVALLVPYGSAQAADEALAKSIENAARLAIRDLAGVQIDLRVYNTGGQPERANAVTVQAANEGAQIILGPVYGGSAKLAGIAAANAGLNVLSLSNNPSVAGGNVFILGPTFENTANRLVRFGVSKGKRNVMVVSGQGPAEAAGRTAIIQAIGGNGATLAGDQTFELSQNGVTAAIPRIAAAAKSAGADAVFFTSGTDGALPFLADGLPQNGISSPAQQFMGLTRWDIPATATAEPGLQNGWFALPDQRLANNFAGRYSAAYGSAPHPLAGLAYDGIAAIGALVKTGNPNAFSAQALTRSSGFVGVNGIFRLMADGTNQRGLAIATIQNNQVIEIDPAPRSFGGAGF